MVYLMKSIALLVTLFLAVSCANSKPLSSTPQEVLTTPDPIDLFLESLDTEPQALVFVHRLEINGVAPLELVVEERCLPETCLFEGSPDYLGSAPAVTRFRAFDVTDIESPTELQKQPLLGSYYASISSAQILPSDTREIVMRSQYAVESGDTFFFHTAFELADGAWEPREVPECSHLGKRIDNYYFAVDANVDGAIDWVSIAPSPTADPRNPTDLGRVEICNLEQTGGFIRLEPDSADDVFEDGALQDALIAALRVPSPDPTEVAVLLVLMKERSLTPATLDGSVEVLIPAYEQVVKHGPPQSAVDLPQRSFTQGDLGLTAACSNPEFDEECYNRKVFEMSVEMPVHTKVTQALYLQALSWPDQESVGNWAAERATSTKSAPEAGAMTELVWRTLPLERAADWASVTAADQVAVLTTGALPPRPLTPRRLDGPEAIADIFASKTPDPSEPPSAAHSPERRAVAILASLLRFTDPVRPFSTLDATIFSYDEVAWDAEKAFAPLYEKAKDDPERLASLIERPELLTGLLGHLQTHDWTTASPRVADALIEQQQAFSYYEGDVRKEVNQMFEQAARRASAPALVPLLGECQVADISGPGEVACAVLFDRILEDVDTIREAGLLDERFVANLGRAWVALDQPARAKWAVVVRDAGLEPGLSAELRRIENYTNPYKLVPIGAPPILYDGAIDIAIESVPLFEGELSRTQMLITASMLAAAGGGTAEQFAKLEQLTATILADPDRSLEVTKGVLSALIYLPTVSSEVAAELEKLKKTVKDPRIVETIDVVLSKPR